MAEKNSPSCGTMGKGWGAEYGRMGLGGIEGGGFNQDI